MYIAHNAVAITPARIAVNALFFTDLPSHPLFFSSGVILANAIIPKVIPGMLKSGDNINPKKDNVLPIDAIFIAPVFTAIFELAG